MSTDEIPFLDMELHVDGSNIDSILEWSGRKWPHLGGRLPSARVTYGEVPGHGWSFLPPFTRQAFGIFRTPGFKNPDLQHDFFIIVRMNPRMDTRRHRNLVDPVTTRFFDGLLYMRRWGRWKAAIID